MIFSAENPLTQSATTEKPYNTTYVLGMCALLLVCILGRAVSNLFVYVFMAVSGVVFLLSSPKHCVTMLFFLMPFSYFLKPSPNGMSFFTVLFFVRGLYDQSEQFCYSLYLLLTAGYYFSSLNSVRYYLVLSIAMFSVKYVLSDEWLRENEPHPE